MTTTNEFLQDALAVAIYYLINNVEGDSSEAIAILSKQREELFK